jgi:hypothetical protein
VINSIVAGRLPGVRAASPFWTLGLAMRFPTTRASYHIFADNGFSGRLAGYKNGDTSLLRIPYYKGMTFKGLLPSDLVRRQLLTKYFVAVVVHPV